MKSPLLSHIRHFDLYQWLIRLKAIDTLSSSELRKIFPLDISKQALLDNLNFLEIIADIAIRNSEEKQFPRFLNNSVLDKLPSIEHDYIFVVNQYINESDSEKFAQNIKRSLSLGMSMLMYEQIKYMSPVVNELGRILILFKNFKKLFKDIFGLYPEQLVFALVMLNYIQKETRGIVNIKTDPNMQILYNYEIFTWTELNKFLLTFAISVKNYKTLAKDMGISKNTIKCQRILSEFPILKDYVSSSNSDIYYIPLSNLLIYSISKTIFPKIYAIQEKARFKGKFGTHFENYVRELSLHSIGKSKLIECTNIVKKENEAIAEFLLEIDIQTALIIEAKAIYIDEKHILNDDLDKLNRAVENDLRKAYKQIQNCFTHLTHPEKFGIIVIMSYLPGLSSLSEHLVQKGFEYTSDNIVIMSIQEFEALIGNKSDIIKNILLKIRDSLAFHKSNVIIETETQGGNAINPYLQSEYTRVIEKNFQTVQSHLESIG